MYRTASNVLLTIMMVLASCSVASNHVDQVPLANDLSIRNATISDSEAITDIILSAFDDAPEWKYVYQFKDQYPEEHFNCYYEAVHEALGIAGVLAQVVLLPNATKPHELIPVAIAFWILPTAWQTTSVEASALSSFSTMSLHGKCEHRDANITRADDYNSQFDAAKKQYLDDVYAKRDQLYLHLLATHPDYQRRGAGTSLLESGLAIGRAAYRKDNTTATLIASVVGEPLYQHLKWQSMHNFTVQSIEGDNGTSEHFKFDVMKHHL